VSPQNGKRIINQKKVNDPPEFSKESDQYNVLEEEKTNLLEAWESAEGSGNEWYGDLFKNVREYKYNNVFTWGSGNTGSQALKTLILYFKNKGIDWKADYRKFSTGLFSFYKNDEESIKIIKKFFIDSLNNYLDLDKDFNIQLSNIDFKVIRK
jgi:hypothetical protein